MSDKYLDWLKEIKKKSGEFSDDSLKKMFLSIHDIYAEQYIILSESKSEYVSIDFYKSVFKKGGIVEKKVQDS